MKLSEEDINDIKTIVEEVQQRALHFDYKDEKTSQFCYDVDMSMRAILEIINGPSGRIEKLVERNV